VETEEREERGSGRSQNVVHTLPRSMASVPGFLTGPLERIDPVAGSTQVLVITADAETAVALAEAVLRMTGPAGIELLPITTARRTSRLMAGRPVLAAAGSPCDVRDLVRGSHLKLDAVKAVVLAWADEILAGDAEDIEALEAVMAELPKDAARIVVTSRSEGRVNAFAERYLRRAHREMPAETEDTGVSIAIQYVTVAATSRGAALRRLLDDLDPPSAVVLVNGDDSEKAASSTLRMLGYDGDAPAVRVTRGEIAPSTHAVIYYDAPASRADISSAAAAAPVAVIALVEPRELSALRLIAGDVKPFTLTAPGNIAREREAAMRRELAALLDSGVAARDVLALEPLLDRYDGIEIAAAALRLLERERTLRKAAQDDARAKQDAAARAAASPPPARGGFEGPAGGRSSGSGERRPSFGGPREGGGRSFDRGASRGGERGRPPREGSGDGRPFRDSRGPRGEGGTRDSRGPRDDAGGARRGPPRGGDGRPPRRDRS